MKRLYSTRGKESERFEYFPLYIAMPVKACLPQPLLCNTIYICFAPDG